MNILYIVSSLNYGGAEKQTVMDANLFCSEHTVFLLSFETGPLKNIIDKKVNYFEFNKKNYVFSSFRLAKFIKEYNIEIVHASLFASMVISAIASMFVHVKVIWHFHSHEYDIPLKSKFAFHYLSFLKSVKKILFVNSELKEYFSFINFPKEKLSVQYNHSTIEQHLFKIKDKTKIVHIGYVGRVIEIKRIEYLVQLALYLKNEKGLSLFKIHIVGDGYALNEIKNKVITLSLENNFVFYGFQKDVHNFYKKFDFFVNPSSEECLSMAMIDAGILGLAIVAFNVGGNNEIVINEKTGFIVKEKDQFFRKCYDLIQDTKKRDLFGYNANVHCFAQFGKDIHYQELTLIYEKVLNRI